MFMYLFRTSVFVCHVLTSYFMEWLSLYLEYKHPVLKLNFISDLFLIFKKAVNFVLELEKIYLSPHAVLYRCTCSHRCAATVATL